MNFSGYFLLHVTSLDDYQGFNFLVDFWIEKNLWGLFAKGFPLLRFFCHLFHSKLREIDPSLERRIRKIELLDEYWIMKWFLQFFIQILPFEFVFRVFDFLIVGKQCALVEVALVVALCLKPVLMEMELEDLVSLLGNHHSLGNYLCFSQFNELLGIYDHEEWPEEEMKKGFLQEFPQFEEFFRENLRENDLLLRQDSSSISPFHECLISSSDYL